MRLGLGLCVFSQFSRQLIFTFGVLVCGLLEAVVAFVSSGLLGVEVVGCCVLICLVPGWLTIYGFDWLRGTVYSSYILLVGIAFRFVFVFLGVFVVGCVRSEIDLREFALYLVVSYLVSLSLETWAVTVPLGFGGK